MFEKSATKYKLEEFVEITLNGQKPFEAVVFLSVGDRLIDLLNDPRLFIPVKRMDNTTLIMAKSNIISIVEKDPFSVEDGNNAKTTGQDVTPHMDHAEQDRFYNSQEGGHAKDGSSEKRQGANSDDSGKTNHQQKAGGRRRRKRSQSFDAYAVLKVSPSASLEEIRKVYKNRIKTVHPDTVAALDLDEDLVKAAIQTTQRINYAYHHILKERRVLDDAEENGASKDQASKAKTAESDSGEAA